MQKKSKRQLLEIGSCRFFILRQRKNARLNRRLGFVAKSLFMVICRPISLHAPGLSGIARRATTDAVVSLLVGVLQGANATPCTLM